MERNAKATKNDDAPVPEFLWDDAIVPEGEPTKISALNKTREFALRWWMKHTTRDFLFWFKATHPNLSRQDEEYRKDLVAGRECISRCCSSSWWEWTAGSRPLFWRWTGQYRSTARDGLPPWIKGPIPVCQAPQRVERDESIHKAIISKLTKVRQKGYIIPGEVKSLTSYFTVPKGDGDVRMVYDATKSGLNGQLWAPWFMLPSVDSHLLAVQPGYFMGDIDISEIFLNFILHDRVQAFAGVDLTPYFPDERTEGKRLI